MRADERDDDKDSAEEGASVEESAPAEERASAEEGPSTATGERASMAPNPMEYSVPLGRMPRVGEPVRYRGFFGTLGSLSFLRTQQNSKSVLMVLYCQRCVAHRLHSGKHRRDG